MHWIQNDNQNVDAVDQHPKAWQSLLPLHWSIFYSITLYSFDVVLCLMIVFRLYVEALVSVSSSLMFFGKFGGNFKTGWELQNMAWLPHIDRQAHDTHAQFPNQLQKLSWEFKLNVLFCLDSYLVINRIVDSKMKICWKCTTMKDHSLLNFYESLQTKKQTHLYLGCCLQPFFCFWLNYSFKCVNDW